MITYSLIKTPIPKCPVCGSDNVLPVIFGLPDDEMSELYLSGKIWLGGCVFDINSSTHWCLVCQTDFIDPDAIIERTKLLLTTLKLDDKRDKEFIKQMEQIVAEYKPRRADK